MRVVYRDRGKGSAELEVYGETHTVLNLLTSYLNKKLLKGYSAYRMEHPLKQEAMLYINTGGEDPKELLVKTIRDLVKDLDSLEKKLSNAISLGSSP